MHKEEVIEKLRFRQEPITYFGETDEQRLNRLLILEKEKPINYETGEESEKKDESIEKEKEKIRLEEEQLENERLKNMTESERKLFNLRLKMNECRKKNLDSLEEEQKEEIKKTFYKSKRKQREEDSNLSITALQSEKIELKKKKKEEKLKPVGWELFNTGNIQIELLTILKDSLYNAHEKRVKEIPYSKEEYQLTKQTKEENEEYEIDNVPEENKNRMVRELEKRIQKRSKFIRRRANDEDADITHINTKNQNFNKKLSRAYDKYTDETKKNLERGTNL